MALINFDETNPPYIVMSASSPVDVPTTTNFFYFQNLVASQRITKTSSTRTTFQESGIYEFNFSARLSVLASTEFFSYSLQYGINGAWVTMATGGGSNFATVAEGIFSLILPINAGDYFELRSVIGVSVSQNITHTSGGNANSTSTIKRIH